METYKYPRYYKVQGGENIGDTIENYDGSASIIKQVDVTITKVWCEECDKMIDIEDLESDEDGGLHCPTCETTLMEYEE